MKRVKWLSLVMAVVMMLSTMASCKSSGGGSADSSSGSAQGETKELNVWAWDVEYNIPVMKEAAKRYEATHPDVKINVTEYSYDDIIQKLNTNLASGITDGLPDIILSEDGSVQKYLNSFPGAFYDMTKKIDFSKFAEYKVKNLTLDGKVYGVPFDTGTEALFYRKDYMDKAGVTEDDLKEITWDQYIQIAKKVKQKTGKDMLTLDPNSANFMGDAMRSSGTWYFTEDGKPNMAGNPALLESLRVYKDLMNSGTVKQTTSWGELAAALNNGDVATITSGCWIVPTITAEKSQSGLWRIAQMPRLNIPDGGNYGNRGGSNWMILSASKNADTAADFLTQIFAGDVDFYDTILTKIGAVGTYLPASTSKAYEQDVEFFGGQKIWKTFSDWSKKVPPIYLGVYTDVADSVMVTSLASYMDGSTNAEETLKKAQELLKQQIG